MHEELEQIAKGYYSYKPLQKVLPRLSNEDLEDLKEDIRKNGIKEPIKVVKLDKNRSIVLDGVHRVKIADELGWCNAAQRFRIKTEIIEAKKEDWFRVGLALNLNAKRGRQIKKRDLVKKLYERYKEKKAGRPSVEEFKKELEMYGLWLTIESVKTYLFGRHKPEHHGQKSRLSGTPRSASNSAQDELSGTPRSASNSAQDAENAQVPPGLSNSTILLNVNSVANQLDTNVEELIKCLFELAPDLQKAAKRFNETPLDMLRKCVEALKKI